ncbi:Uncharacterized phage-associated protein [Capnocytophaga granulosa]|jgi:hypothetical protein|uniref:Uncharacterized phage-associated protein n=1 Tax=Capnocytophaga granulosa TaxID=45242 RepID=A0A1H2WCC7_9FLAO|nr:Panacea domain-containing protein [Capnocytophaga granulosa]EPD28009.1 hypothetical protein HMPREF9331_01761 [Capnocytophaga granulosa ATCC 51502]SDW78175.1 Uncharacterized phage-associated protein [Capnocytophaga granulosa]SUX19757.1 Uncharacterized phage-associated protein [Capnocytophaga granulosa]
MFDIDESKAINSILFVLNELGDKKSDAHKVFKILYFADQKHLVTYGRPITGDTYLKMTYGPVPSFIRDVSEGKKKEGFINKTKKHFLTTSYPYDKDDLSESEIECLKEAIDENKDLSFNDLTEKSHDSAWQKAQRDISYIDMAKAVTSDPDILNYIKVNALNEQIIF